jgi:hypothetical protein
MSEKQLVIPKKIQASWMDVEELAAKVLDVHEQWENDTIDRGELEEKIYEKFDCSMETFEEIVSALMPFTVLSKSELSDSYRIGFVDHVAGVYVVKHDIQ